MVGANTSGRIDLEQVPIVVIVVRKDYHHTNGRTSVTDYLIAVTKTINIIVNRILLNNLKGNKLCYAFRIIGKISIKIEVQTKDGKIKLVDPLW